ncbi:putative short-subunit dehydrogenase-like oxidoreductase (DUF2520 family) [Arcticibacter pallidicorallinus]|uniref:Putative short-subunit dehydrogenase-like oxidoreductase (DUF2520 family) n=1 Tax=Arcticibacter pallidicorallinus TaxID=1259464 RepID=A0A2T0U464_9SPHI|nr:Rossmann-like and DUF2520 domain-containing protein [Arcticibacter pallidicorallinus]PRY52703.1 putative short-subunit dehydrogenase-like oxidoreductase (DUF2520 family) [Arcticibacter pallidicorallinus]
MKIVLLGSGNVATHLGHALKTAGHEILQVWSRSLSNAQQLADSLSAAFTNEIGALNNTADIYILSIKDDAIEEVASSFLFKGKLLVHTSGTAGIDLLGKEWANKGVFYPLQTFSKQKGVDFSTVPLLLEGSNEKVVAQLNELAASISQTVRPASSEQRAAIHVAAVFACNFSNHLYSISKDLLAKEGLDFKLLLPLIAETAAKVQSLDPKAAQTGPAIRGDQASIEKHKKYLEASPDLQQLYTLMTNSIIGSKK